MKGSKWISLLLAAVFAVSMSEARISGRVTDSIGDPLAGATLVLIQLPDSAIADAQSADSTGYFSLKAAASERYILQASFPGCKTNSRGVSDGESLDIVLGTENATVLSELRVSTKKPQVSYKLGEFTILPNSYKQLANNSFDLLTLMPMIEYSGDKVKIFGTESSTIYLNGRKPMMDQDQVMRYLMSIPPENIREFVLIRESGASNRGPIINVILDRPEEGFLGSVYLGARYSEAFETDNHISLWYAKDRLSLSFITSPGNSIKVAKRRVSSLFKDSGVETEEMIWDKQRQSSWNNTILAQYKLTSNSTLNALVNLNYYANRQRSSSVTSTNYPDGRTSVEDSRYVSHEPKRFLPVMAWLKYNLDLDKRGSYFELSAAYKNDQGCNVRDWTVNDVPTNSQGYENHTIGYNINADLVKKLGNSSLEAGYGLLRAFNHDRQVENSTLLKDDFRYRELIHSLYGNYKFMPLGWMTMNLGVRFELSHQHIEQGVNSEKAKSNFFNVLPQASLEFYLPKQNILTAKYEMILSRPRYSWMNPVEYWINTVSFRTGNPDLRPTVYHSFTVSYMLKYKFFAGVVDQLAHNMIDMNYTEASPGVTKMSYDNFGNVNTFYPYIGFKDTYFNRWTLQATTGTKYVHSDGGELYPGLTKESWAWMLNLYNNFIISRRHRFSATVYFTLESPQTTLIGSRRWKGNLSARLIKQFGRDWNVLLSVSNIVPPNSTVHIDTPELLCVNRTLTNHVWFSLGVNYTFGRSTVRQVTGGGSAIEKRM